ncbi:NUDIX domain-containing protein [Mycoplasmatota bacterium]|nr:NUDIX domain-containing protein [Mycoplasmatota bacterium]
MIVKYGKKRDLPIREAVRGVIRKGNDIGIIKVNKYDCFIFPGGGVDKGEDLESALKREMLEETGYKVKVNKLILTTETSEVDFHHVNHYFECELVGPASKAKLTDVEIELGIEFDWINIDELYKYYLNYEDDSRFGDMNMLVQRSIKSRGYLLLSKYLRDQDLYFDFLRNWIGKEVKVKVDRPVGFTHRTGTYYPINYGYIDNIFALDGGKVDAYILDSDEAIDNFTGKVIGVIYREDDVEEKLIISNEDYSDNEILEKVNFVEKYFKSILVR